MIPFAGILIVLAAVAGGFLIESGSVGKLVQPAELVIILGSALGAMMAANPLGRLVRTVRAVGKVFRRPVYTKELYLSTLSMLHAIFHFARRKGAAALEDAVEDADRDPGNSALFSGSARAVSNPEVVAFVCDTLRLSSLGMVSPWNLDQMLENDLDIRDKEIRAPVRSLEMLSDSLPGFGIVSAVLGVILAMGSIRKPPIVVGIQIASALIGTFTGILMAYGIVAPIAARLEKIEEAESLYFQSLRAGLMAFARGMPSAIAVECARRAIPPDLRPDFETMELECKRTGRIGS